MGNSNVDLIENDEGDQRFEKLDATECAIQVPQVDYERHDIKKRQVFGGLDLVALCFGAIGTIYGDIGTSPLYVYSSTFTSAPSRIELLCTLSVVLWALFLMVTVKYILIVLCADDAGEGGTLALFSLICRYAHISHGDPARPVEMRRHLTQDMKVPHQKVRSTIESSKFLRALLNVLAIVGVCMVLADGVLTPAQSVLGAIQGTSIVNPNLSSWTIVGITCGVLLVIFAGQPLGIGRLAFLYSPIVVLWLLWNFTCGAYNLAKYDASVLRAFNPYYAFKFFTLTFEDGDRGWHRLGGPLLAFTGVEALFADLGAFGRSAIRLSWLLFAFPCLMVAYIGQAANISVNPDNYANPFFLTAIPHTIWPSLMIAILAAIVASQALITGAFNIISQAMNISYFPRLHIKHTSLKVHGQVYVPVVNWILLIGCIIVTCAYSNTTRLGNAYGLCVVCVTFFTTILVSIAAIVVWRLHLLLVLAGFLFFATLDGLWLSTALFKIPKGAWFTILVAGLLSMLMGLYRWGKSRQWSERQRNTTGFDEILAIQKDGSLALSQNLGGGHLTTITGIGIYMDDLAAGVPDVFVKFISIFRAVHQIALFVHFRQIHAPYVSAEERFEFKRADIPNQYRVIVRGGYNEKIGGSEFTDAILPSLLSFLQFGLVNAEKGSAAAAKVESEIATLETAMASGQLAFLLAKNEFETPQNAPIIIRKLVGLFDFVRENTRTRPATWELPKSRLVELGFIKEI